MEYIILVFLLLLIVAGIYRLQAKVFNAKRAGLISKRLRIANQTEYLKFANSHFLDSLHKLEKENCLRMADLHDSLGSMIALLKLNFDNIRMHPEDVGIIGNSHLKIDMLLNEAYQKVVSLSSPIYIGDAELKLLQDLKAIAAWASGLSNINVSVVSYGLIMSISHYKQLTIVYVIQQVLFIFLGYACFQKIEISITQNTTHIYIVLEIDSKAGGGKNAVSVFSYLKDSIESMGREMVVLSESKKIQINIPL